MRQTLAIFLDSYRELNSKMMFWISLSLSGVIVLALAAVGIDEEGLTLLWFKVPAFINTTVVPAETFYKFLFATFGVGTWLSFGAMGLAFISTSSIMPDFVSAGSVELTLSRPMSRVRLFLTKYFAAMTFVVLQVTIFTIASIVVIGVRGGEWIPGLLLTIPLTTLIFSYMYSISAFVGVLTRSTIAAVLAVAVCWFAFFAINTIELVMLRLRVEDEVNLRQVTKEVEVRTAQIAKEEQRRVEVESGARSVEDIEGLRRTLNRKVDEKERLSQSVINKMWWHRLTLVLKTPVPKNAETLALLEYSLTESGAFQTVMFGPDDDDGRRGRRGGNANQRLIDKEFEEIERSRGWLYVIGTSLLFEVVMVGATALIFWRRDF